jgi:K+-sensing histidine kinase KdpD
MFWAWSNSVRGFTGANWLWRVRPGSVEAYAFATLLVVVASLIRWVLGYVGDDIFVFAAYYPAVLFATYVGGAGVGGFAAGLGAVIGWWAFLPPHYTFFPILQAQVVRVLAYLFASALIIWGAESYRNRRQLSRVGGTPSSRGEFA